VAVSLARLGSEAGDVHVIEVETGKELTSDVVRRVNNGTAGGSVAWNADGTGFYYTRYPQSGERAPADLNFYQQIYFHKLGSPVADDRYETGKDFPWIAEIALRTS
jgi:prolyl oligopeptidase